MSDDPSGDESLDSARQRQSDAARPDVVTRLHERGKLTARERLGRLLDAESQVEYGSIAAKTHDGEWIAEAGGVDFIGAIDGQTVVASSTDYSDHGGGYGAGRLGRLYALALEHRWPVVLFVDGGGSRARHPRGGMGHIETSGNIGRFNALDGVIELSGWAPTIAIVSGPSFAGHASIAGFSDFLIATTGSAIGMGGPPMVEAALGKRMTPQELAGSEMHEGTGGIDLLVNDEQEAIDAARRYLSYYRGNADPKPPQGELTQIDVTDYDMRDVIDAIVDAGTLFELRPQFARSVITALARIEGRSIGVIANQPRIDDGAIDPNGATKISRFVETCNAYEYPIVSLVDTPGCMNAWRAKDETVTRERGISRWHARPLMAHQQRTVALLAVQINRGYGLGAALMTGVSSTRVPALKVAWPNVELARTDGYSAVIDHNAFDDVIAPAQTRDHIARLLRHLSAPPARTSKKHRIDTW